MLTPSIEKNDSKAKAVIWIVSIVVFLAVAVLSKYKLDAELGFNPHVFAEANALINSLVAILLLAGLIVIKQGKYQLHKTIMLTAIVLSVFFLISYIGHHLLAGETRFGDSNHDGMVSEEEKSIVGGVRTFYYLLLLTHIP